MIPSDRADHLLPMSPPLDLPPFPRVIDATMRSDWLVCPHRFFRRHIQGLVPATRASRPNVHLHFGAAVARGLEVARRGYTTHHDAKDALTDGCEAAIAAWGEFDGPPNPSRTERNKTLANCLLALQAYLHEWPLDEDPVQIHYHNSLPCIEFSGAAPILGVRHPNTDEPILYSGRFDLIGDYQSSTWGLDDKTTGMDPNADSWRNQWRLRSQFSGYTWLAREYGLTLRGFIVRGIGVLTDSIRLGFAITPRPPWLVDAWHAQLRADVAQMVAQYVEWSRMPPSVRPHSFRQVFDHACADFGGCTFLDLCGSEHPDKWLGDFIERRWNPLERDNN